MIITLTREEIENILTEYIDRNTDYKFYSRSNICNFKVTIGVETVVGNDIDDVQYCYEFINEYE